MGDITRYPICWPNNVRRTDPAKRTWPKFAERSIASATNFVLQEINRLNQRHWDYRDEYVIISTNLKLRQDGLPIGNQPQPTDGGVAVYFNLRFQRNGKWFERHCVLTCDKWLKIENNLTAIGKDIEAQRGRERWGCTSIEQAFAGYLAIPEKTGGSSWWVTLGIPSNANAHQIKTAYQAMARKHHPDKGGNSEEWLKIDEAYQQAMGQLGS